MNQVLNLSDIEVILSDEEAGSVIRSASQASPPTRARPAPDRADRARFVDGDPQALRPAQLPLRRPEPKLLPLNIRSQRPPTPPKSFVIPTRSLLTSVPWQPRTMTMRSSQC